MKWRLTATELHTLRNELIEHRELHAEKEHLAQVRRYLAEQLLPVEFGPSVLGIRITLKTALDRIANGE